MTNPLPPPPSLPPSFPVSGLGRNCIRSRHLSSLNCSHPLMQETVNRRQESDSSLFDRFGFGGWREKRPCRRRRLRVEMQGRSFFSFTWRPNSRFGHFSFPSSFRLEKSGIRGKQKESSFLSYQWSDGRERSNVHSSRNSMSFLWGFDWKGIRK